MELRPCGSCLSVLGKRTHVIKVLFKKSNKKMILAEEKKTLRGRESRVDPGKSLKAAVILFFFVFCFFFFAVALVTPCANAKEMVRKPDYS